MNHEYLVYLNNRELSDSEFEAVYQILQRLSFPQNRNPLNAEYVNALSTFDRTRLVTNESQVILEKLQEINPEINIALFPKSLYQYYMFCAFEHTVLSPAHAQFVHMLDELHTSKIMARRNSILAYGQET